MFEYTNGIHNSLGEAGEELMMAQRNLMKKKLVKIEKAIMSAS